MLLLNSEATKTNGAIKPCQSPSQKPATTPCSLAVPLDWLSPGAHPARMFNNSRASTSKVREDFIAIPPLHMVTKHGHEKSQNDRQIRPIPFQNIRFLHWDVATRRRTLRRTPAPHSLLSGNAHPVKRLPDSWREFLSFLTMVTRQPL